MAINAIGLARRLGPADVRNVVRDPMLLWALALPPAVALLLQRGVPALAEWLAVRFAFDLVPFYPLIAGSYLLIAPAIVGFIGGFLLLDERDDRVLDALRVLPVSMRTLLTYRLGVPLALGTFVTIAGYPIIGLTALPPTILGAAAVLAAGTGPILALFLSAFADNKVSGFALAKVLSAVSNLALVAWFVPMPWQIAAGVVPSYWAMKVVWQSAAAASWLAYAAAGLAVNGIVTVLLLHRLNRVLSR
jgi:fluoroquinolone transport system permease protein